MKKTLLGLFMLFAFSAVSEAQTAGGYAFTSSSGSYARIPSGTLSTATGDDGRQEGIAIGFPFTFGGASYSYFSITTNGFIKLGNASTTISTGSDNYTNALGNSAANRPLIAPLWDDNNSTDSILYAVTGSSPNQKLIVEWRNLHIGGGGSSTNPIATFQVVLNQTSNVIQFQYDTVATFSSVTASIGLNDSTSFLSVTPGVTPTVSNGTANNSISSSTSLTRGLTYTFTPPSCVNPSNVTFTSVALPSAAISWSAVAGAASYQYAIDSSAANPATGTTTTATTATVSGLPTNVSTIYAHVRTNCGTSFSSWSNIAYNLPPANDSCGTPISLSPNVTINGTTVTSTQSLAPSACTGYSSIKAYDVWYKVTVPSTGDFIVNVVGSSAFDAVLGIYHGTCGALVLDTCRDATISGGTEAITFNNAVAGSNYLIRVYRYYTSSDSTGTFTITASGPALPVTGVNLTATRNGKNVQLGWQTLTEMNNAGFELQRSADGSGYTSFLKVASKANGGNSTSAINYTADDIKPFSGANYYRLKQTDKDGKISYSNVVFIKGLPVSNLTLSAVYPNPTHDMLKAAIQSPAADKITFVISDMTGKLISRQVSSVTNGDNTVNLNVANLPSGNYLLKAICSNGCETAVQKFTKQ